MQGVTRNGTCSKPSVVGACVSTAASSVTGAGLALLLARALLRTTSDLGEVADADDDSDDDNDIDDDDDDTGFCCGSPAMASRLDSPLLD